MYGEFTAGGACSMRMRRFVKLASDREGLSNVLLEAIAEASRSLQANPPERTETRAYAEQFDQEDTTRGQQGPFRQILDGAATG